MDRIQILAIIGAIAFVLFIIELIRRKQLKEAYSIIWLLFAGIFLFFSIFRSALDYCSLWIGIAYPPAMLFLLLIIAIIFVLIQFSVIISSNNDKIRVLTQEIAILKNTIENLKDPNKKPD